LPNTIPSRGITYWGWYQGSTPITTCVTAAVVAEPVIKSVMKV
jgi:hypothetical protein